MTPINSGHQQVFQNLAILIFLSLTPNLANSQDDVQASVAERTYTQKQQEEAAELLKQHDASVRYFYDKDDPRHWVQIVLGGDQFDDSAVQLAAIAAGKGRLDLHLQHALVTASGIRKLRSANLSDLALSGEAIDDHVLAELPHFSQLKVLQIASPAITDAGVAHIGKCPAVYRLQLRGKQLTGAALRPLGELKNLTRLGLGKEFDDTAIEAVNQLPQLQSLGLGPNVTNRFLSQLNHLPKLVELTITGPNVDDETIPILTERAKSLEKLYARRTQITDDSLASIARMANLKLLTLDGTPIGDEGVRHLVNLKKLEWLDLSDAVITDDSLEIIGQLPKLRMLFLMNTEVTDDGLEFLRDVPNLRHLDIQSTKVTAVPEWLRSKQKLYISWD